MASKKKPTAGYTERNFPRYYETGPHPVVLAFDYAVQEALRGTAIQIASTTGSDTTKHPAAGKDQAAASGSTQDGAPSSSHRNLPTIDTAQVPLGETRKPQAAGAAAAAKTSTNLAFGTRVGGDRSLSRKTASDGKESKTLSEAQGPGQQPVCRWSNALAEVVSRYQHRLGPLNYTQRVVAIGNAIFKQKHYQVARDVCYRNLAIPSCIGTSSYEESQSSAVGSKPTTDQAGFPADEVFENDEILAASLKATCGFLKCEFEILLEQDPQLLNASTCMAAVRLVHNWHDTGRRSATRSPLCYITFNATVNIYKIATRLLNLGYAGHVLPYLLWSCTIMEQVVPLRRIRYVEWRGQVYTAACLAYSACGMPAQSELVARHALDELLFVKKAEEESGNGAELDKVAFQLMSTCVQMNIMVFRRNVFESKKRPKGVLRPRNRPTLKEMEPLLWPRNDVERLLLKQFPWGRASQMVAVMQTVEDPRRRILRSAKPDPFLYMSEKAVESKSSSSLGRRPMSRRPSADSAGGPSLFIPQPDIDTALLMDVWYELFYAAADLVATALGIKGTVQRIAVELVDSASPSVLMALAAERRDAITTQSAVSLVKFSYSYEIWDVVDFLLPPLLKRLAASKSPEDLVNCKQLEIISAVRCIQNQLGVKGKKKRVLVKGILTKLDTDRISLVSPPHINDLRPEQMEALGYLDLVLNSCLSEPIKSAENLDQDVVNDALLLAWAAANPFFGKLNELADGTEELLQQEHLHLWLRTAHTMVRGMQAFGLASSDHRLFVTVSSKLALLLEILAVHVQQLETPSVELVTALHDITDAGAYQTPLNTVMLRPASLLLKAVAAESHSTLPAAFSRIRMGDGASRNVGSRRPAVSKMRRSRMTTGIGQSRSTTTRGNTLSKASKDSLVLPPIGETAASTPASSGPTPSQAGGSKSSIPTLPQIHPQGITGQPAGAASSSALVPVESGARAGDQVRGKRAASVAKSHVSASPGLASIMESNSNLGTETRASSAASNYLKVMDPDTVSSISRALSTGLTIQSLSSFVSQKSGLSVNESDRVVSAVADGGSTDDITELLKAMAMGDESQHTPIAPPCSVAILNIAASVLQQILSTLDTVSYVTHCHELTTDSILFTCEEARDICHPEYSSQPARERAESGGLTVDILLSLYRIKLQMACMSPQESNVPSKLAKACEDLQAEVRQNKRCKAILNIAAAHLLQKYTTSESAPGSVQEEKNTMQTKAMLEEACGIVLEALHEEATDLKSLSFPHSQAARRNSPASKIPPAPLLVGFHGGTACLVPQPFVPESGEKIATVRLFACQASGVRPKARLDSYKFPGSGLDVAYNERASFAITGLKKNVKYIFALAAYTDQGTLIGKSIGESTEPLLVSRPLPLIPICGKLAKCALRCQNSTVVRASSSLLWNFFIDQNGLRDHTLTMAPLFLRHFVHTMLAQFHLHNQELGKSADRLCISATGNPKELQAQRLVLCRQVLTVLTVINHMNDTDLAVQAVVMVFCVLVREIQMQVVSPEAFKVLLICHCVLQELSRFACNNERLQSLMFTDYRVQLLSAIIANYVERSYGQLTQQTAAAAADSSANADLQFQTAVVTNTLDYLRAATGYVLQPFAEAMNSHGTTKAKRCTLARRPGGGPPPPRALRRSVSMSRIPLKQFPPQPEVIAAIQALLESQAYLSTVVPASNDGRLVPVAFDDRCQLHTLINKFPPAVAFRGLQRCMKRSHYLEFFVRLVEVCIRQKQFKSVLEWSAETFAWLSRRSDMILRKDKTDIDEHLQNRLINAAKSLGRSLSFVEYNRVGEPYGQDITLMDIGGSDRKESWHVWKQAHAAVPSPHPRDNRHIWRALILHGRLPVLWRLGRNRKRLRAISSEEMPWRSRLNYLLATVYFSLYIDELQSQVGRLPDKDKELDRCRLQPSWFNVGTTGGVVVGGGSLADPPKTFDPHDLDEMNEDDKYYVFQASSELDYDSRTPSGDNSADSESKKSSVAARRSACAVVAAEKSTVAAPDVSGSAVSKAPASRHPSQADDGGVFKRHPSQTLSSQSSMASLAEKRGLLHEGDGPSQAEEDAAAHMDAAYVESHVNEAMEIFEHEEEDDPALVLTPDMLLKSKKLQAMKLYLTRAIVLASRSKNYMLLQEAVRFFENVQREILAVLVDSAGLLVASGARINGELDLLSEEHFPQAVRDCETQCKHLLQRRLYKITFTAADGIQDMLSTIHKQQPKLLDGLLEKMPFSAHDEGALLSFLEKQQQRQAEAVDRTPSFLQTGNKRRQKTKDRGGSAKTIGKLCLFTNLTFNPDLDDSAGFGIDMRWLVQFMLASLQALYLQSRWEMVVDVGTRFNAITKDACTLYLCPMLVSAQQSLATKLAAAQAVVQSETAQMRKEKILKRIREAAHLDPSGERIYDHIRCRSARPVNSVPLTATLRAYASELRPDMHMLYHSRLLRLTYIASCSTALGWDTGLQTADANNKCTVCCHGQSEEIDWQNMCINYAIGQTVGVQHVAEAYRKTLDLLKQNRETSLACQALAELAAVHFHAGDIPEACVCWETCLEDLLESGNCVKDWREMPSIKSRTTAAGAAASQVRQPQAGHGQKKSVDSAAGDEVALDTSSHGLNHAADALLDKCDIWGCLLGAQAAIKLARYSCVGHLDMQNECTLMAVALIKGVMRASQPYSVMDDLDYASHAVCDPGRIIPGVELFSDKYRCDAVGLAHDLMWLCRTLVDRTFHFQALPLLWFLICIASHVTRCVADVTEAMCMQVEILSKLRLFSKATNILISLLTGHSMPVKLAHLDATCSKKTSPLMPLKYQDHIPPHACENTKTLVYICGWTAHRNLPKVYSKPQVDRIDLTVAHYLTGLATAIPLVSPTADDVNCAQKLQDEGQVMLDTELAPNLSLTALVPPEPELLGYATAAGIKLVLIQKAVILFEAIHNFNIAVTGEEVTSAHPSRGARESSLRPLQAVEAEMVARCRLGLCTLAMDLHQHLAAAHHARHALRVLEIYSGNLDNSLEHCSADLSLAHSHLTAWLWLEARLSLVRALSAAPSREDRPTEEDQGLGSVAAHCQDGVTEAEAVNSNTTVARFNLWLAADQMKTGNREAQASSHKLMHKVVIVITSHKKPHPACLRDTLFHCLPPTAGLLSAVLEEHPELAASLQELDLAMPADVFAKRNMVARHEANLLGDNTLSATASGTVCSGSEEDVTVKVLSQYGGVFADSVVNTGFLSFQGGSSLEKSRCLATVRTLAATTSLLVDMPLHTRLETQVLEGLLLLHEPASSDSIARCIQALATALHEVDDSHLCDHRLMIGLQSVLAMSHIWCSRLAGLGMRQEATPSARSGSVPATPSKPPPSDAKGWLHPPANWSGNATTAWNLIRAAGCAHQALTAFNLPENNEYAKKLDSSSLLTMPPALRRCLCGPNTSKHHLPMLEMPELPSLIEVQSVDIKASSASWSCGHTPTWQEVVLYRYQLGRLCQNLAASKLPPLYSTLCYGVGQETAVMKEITDQFLMANCSAYSANCSTKMKAIGWKTATNVPPNFHQHFADVEQQLLDKIRGCGLAPEASAGKQTPRKAKDPSFFKAAQLSYVWWRPTCLGLGDCSADRPLSVLQFVVDSLRDETAEQPPLSDTVVLVYAGNKSPMTEPISGKDYKSINVGCKFLSLDSLGQLTTLLDRVLEPTGIVFADRWREGTAAPSRRSTKPSASVAGKAKKQGSASSELAAGKRANATEATSLRVNDKDLGELRRGVLSAFGFAESTEFIAPSAANLQALRIFLDAGASAGEIGNKALKTWFLRNLMVSVPPGASS